MNNQYRKDFIITVFSIFCLLGSVISFVFIPELIARILLGVAFMISFCIAIHSLSCNKKDVRVSYINNFQNEKELTSLSPVEVINTRI